ncbi:glyoxalase [Herminiimonas sp. KBW02]|uniref:VOC family protein n=1 Tax=Herminiimonas sp. KBW02 TaxID=2153363 RepID=UPI000F5B1D55|nr:VOC family protein [Herminiimonas sp. KBW02]RQO37291.1 glyoxalase [Herminiimonas sp. KBW02]
MSKSAVATKSTIIPCLRYRDALAAIDWLCEVFGFEKQAVYTNPDGSVAHAQLILGGGMLMIGSVVTDSEWGKLIRQPDDIGGDETQSPYLVVADADLVYERALKRDAEIVIDIKFEDYGGRGFSCRDLEGRLWSIGTYDPWQ